MPFTPDEIEFKEFVPILRGFSREEVRAYLRSVSEKVRRLEDKLEDKLEAAKSSTRVPQADDVPVAPCAEQQGHLSIESSFPVGGPPTITFAAAGLAAGELRLVTDLRDALSELTRAVSQLSKQGFRAQSFPTQMAASPEPTPAPLSPETIRQPSRIPVLAKGEPPFVHVKPLQVTNSGLGKCDQAHWDGIDQRGPKRPWNSAPEDQSTNTTVLETLLVGKRQILAHRQDAEAFPLSAYDPVSTGESKDVLPIDRELRNRNLICSFLDGALGRNQTLERDVANRGVRQTTVEPRIHEARPDHHPTDQRAVDGLRTRTSASMPECS